MAQAEATPPDFTLRGLDGLEYSLHEATGKGPVVLAFWQKDCGTCKLAAPYLNRLYNAYENMTWSFWAIAQNGDEDAAAFVRDFDFRPTVLIDAPLFVASRLYDPDATPTLYVVEPERGVALVSSGFVKDELNEISRTIAAYSGTDYVEVAPDDDGNPKFKPG
jgi:peroxiredoxin